MVELPAEPRMKFILQNWILVEFEQAKHSTEVGNLNGKGHIKSLGTAVSQDARCRTAKRFECLDALR